MATLTITPETFTMVLFDAAVLRATAEELIDRIALPSGTEVHLEVQESIPLGRTHLTLAGTTVTCVIEGGAFEDPKRPRQLSVAGVQNTFGRLILRARDMLDPAFGTPPADDQLTLAQRVAWDAYSEGRLHRMGYPQRTPRRRYHFRMRHGFSDVADRVFDRLWEAGSLTWADLDAACAETATAVPA
jgi:hypothetical protein